MLNEELFSKMMTMLCEVYSKEQTKPLMQTYYFVLKDMRDNDFQYAVLGMLKSRVYPSFPKPAEIMQEKLEDSYDIWIKVLKKRGHSDDEIMAMIEEDRNSNSMKSIK